MSIVCRCIRLSQGIVVAGCMSVVPTWAADANEAAQPVLAAPYQGLMQQLAKASLLAGDASEARDVLRTIRGLPGQGRTSDRLLGAVAAVPGAPQALSALRALRGSLRATPGKGF